MWKDSTVIEQMKIVELGVSNDFTADLSLEGWSLSNGVKYMCFVTSMNLGVYDLGYDLSLTEIRKGVFKVNVLTKRVSLLPNPTVSYYGNRTETFSVGKNTVKYSVCQASCWGGYGSNIRTSLSLNINGAPRYSVSHSSMCVKSTVVKKDHGSVDSVSYSMHSESGECSTRITEWELVDALDKDCKVTVLFIKGRG